MIIEEKKAGEFVCPQGMISDHVYKDRCRGSCCMAWRWDKEEVEGSRSSRGQHDKN